MKDLIKKQEEELRLHEERRMYDDEFIGNFISKVRKETAEFVCDKMTGDVKTEHSIGGSYGYNFMEGYNNRVEEEKEIKKEFLINLNK